jgi:phage terminase large subunit-like protein
LEKNLDELKNIEVARSLNRKESYYLNTGPLRRELYSKHIGFFTAGSDFRERLFIAGNRTGKTTVAAYEVSCHVTGVYPEWWRGRRFDRPIKCWVAGESGKKVREVVQELLLGPPDALGTGMIPAHCISSKNMKSGVPDAIDTASIRHASGDNSHMTFKSYEQGREGFDGDAIHVIWLDEEATVEIYVECLLRTMTTDGILMQTYTPLSGLSELVKLFLPSGTLEDVAEGKHVSSCTWDQVPHLDEKEKAGLLRSIPPYQKDARSKGIPSLGSGAIYPVAESDITVDDFSIPDGWPRAYGMDVGWNMTGGVWFAQNPDTGVIYLYAEYYRSKAEPVVHAHGFRAKGEWIPGFIDPASRGRSQKDGFRLLDMYLDLGLKIEPALNARESGIQLVYELLSSGRLKVFKDACPNWLKEYRMYQRDEKGNIVKKDDHLMDATRYFVLSGRDRMSTGTVKSVQEEEEWYSRLGNMPGPGAWMGK